MDFFTIKPEVATSAGGQLREKQHDNGDGTSSPVIYIDGVTLSGPINISNEVEVKNDSGAPVPISAVALPLPTGAATAVHQIDGNAALNSIDAKLNSQATAAIQSAGNVSLASMDAKLTGVATAANQVALNATVGAAADSAASTDTGTFTLVALFKRLLTKLSFAYDGLTGALKTQEQYVPKYEDNTKGRAYIQRPGIPLTITTAATTTVVGPYHINSIRVIGGTLGNVTVYDATSATGTPIIPAVLPIQGQVLLEDVDVLTGLTVVTANATILLVSYGY